MDIVVKNRWDIPHDNRSLTMEEQQWIQEANVWSALYKAFVDDSNLSMQLAFYKNGCGNMSASELHQVNVDWIKQIGLFKVQQCDVEKSLKSYLREASEPIAMQACFTANTSCVAYG